ncbi:type II toxin-antitoxin system VapC family toxin [Afifella sp. YEN Y35]|uniref:type II toxin-antitoxin system VapC family toxin n=1 Tax=Afifella sp. YEN Y35 TaxID=3388337 RepID=UPI0039DF9CF0
MSLVLDSSVALSWFFRDEQTEISRVLLERVAAEAAVVPSLWRYEIANALQTAVRRQRIDTAFRDRALTNLAALPIEIDPECDDEAWAASTTLAERHRLTVYDAAYLELAQRRSLPLATFDTDLIAAAGEEMVPLAAM